MKQRFLTAGCSIDPTAGTFRGPNGELEKIRPRTLDVLLLLISDTSKVYSKAEILDSVWPGTVVGEHVVFQSINEIRQLFTPQDVIKTIPKRGYRWVEPVIVESEQRQPDKQSVLKRIKSTHSLLIGLCCIFLGMLIWINNQPESRISGSIVVLPFNNDMNDNDHNWVTYGGMDELIQLLASTDYSGVLSTDYVLEVMSRANTNRTGISSEDIKQIFVVSGASLIVETTISGSPQEYEMLYTLHRQSDSSKGVIFSQNISRGIEELANEVSHKSGLAVNAFNTDYYSEFANELIANAIEAHNAKQNESAKRLLKAAVGSEPDNLVAKRLLLQIAVEEEDFATSNRLAKDLQSSVKKEPSLRREFVSVVFWLALNELQQRNFAAALPLLAQAETWANELNDWLYLAYIEEMRGQLAQFHKKYEEAEAHYKSAMRFHQVLQCPHGESNGLLNLSMLAYEQGDNVQANALAQKALTLIRKRQLNELEIRAIGWTSRLNSLS